MLRSSPYALALVGLLALGLTRAYGAPPVQDARALSARIDELIGLRLAMEEIPPAPPADDAEFFRRLSLDLNGRIPAVTQFADFLEDTRPDKRRLIIDELLDGPENAPLYVQHFAHFWRRQLLAQTAVQPEAVVAPLEGWLRRQLKANTPYDRLVRGLLTDANAAGFYLANENKAEDLAGRTSRLFLGVKLECAQCHDDRSGGNWKRTQFWEYAAFFTGLRDEQGGPDLVVAPRMQNVGPARIRVGGLNTWVEARFPDGSKPDWRRAVTPRQALSEWIARGDNPWFARAAVNRLWHYFLGVGLIDPVDGLGTEDNPPSHPELLDELAGQFVAHDFDLKFLVRAIAGSSAYQRTSRQTHPRQAEPRLFARAASRALTPEQLYDSLVLATGYRPDPAKGAAFGPFRAGSPRAVFLAAFDDPSSQPVDFHSSVQQALMMMNGQFAEEATSSARSTTVAVVIESNRPVAQRIEELYLVTLARKPQPREARRLLDYAAARESKQALRDIFWSLLNSTEFVLNH
jgi:Protein of unknown function (DUF1553)/Protein of unknown function (DUF1549)